MLDIVISQSLGATSIIYNFIYLYHKTIEYSLPSTTDSGPVKTWALNVRFGGASLFFSSLIKSLMEYLTDIKA